MRLGNWLTAEQGQALWHASEREQVKGKRDRAPLASLPGHLQRPFSAIC